MLTDIACKAAACPSERVRVRLSDSAGLYLEVAPNGSKRWFWKYYFDGKEKRLALGAYPEVKIKQARISRDEARGVQRQGIDPAQQRQLDRLKNRQLASTTFEAVAREFHATKLKSWSKQYAERWIGRMEKDMFPWIGSLPIAAITAPVLLGVLRRVEKRGAIETTHTLCQNAGQVFLFGVASGRCERNPAPDLKGALAPVVGLHVGAIVDHLGAMSLMKDIMGYQGHLRKLRLLKSGERLEAMLQHAAAQELPYAEFLEQVLGEEVAAKASKNIAMRTAMARFPVIHGSCQSQLIDAARPAFRGRVLASASSLTRHRAKPPCARRCARRKMQISHQVRN